MTNDKESIEKPAVKRKSLLAKYEIPVDHLSYEYIKVCNNIKELEKIIKVLRSGEEGNFPDLQKTAEERLRVLSPENRYLRVEAPALNRSCFNKEEWGEMLSEISSWKKEMSERDSQLTANNPDEEAVYLPPVRQTTLSNPSSLNTEKKAKSKPRISDYAIWDKYDVDTELIKIDLEEEKKNVKKGSNAPTKRTEKDRLELVVQNAIKLSEAEKRILADEEKIRGNEYFQAKDYSEAEKYYSASIAIRPTTNAYNNRAACYLKQGEYSAAIEDANRALQLDPHNVKALFRKGIALKNKKEWNKALENMYAVLKQEPNDSQTRKIAKEVEEKIANLACAERTALVDDSVKQIHHNGSRSYSRSGSNSCFEVNEWGLPKVSCKCEGPLRCTEYKPNIHSSSLAIKSNIFAKSKAENPRITEISDTSEQPNQRNSTKLKIIEIENPPNEPMEDFCKPSKRNIVDKRTRKLGQGLGLGGGDVL